MKNRNEVIIGALIGLGTTALGTLLYLLYVSYQRNASLGAVWDFAVNSGEISSVVVYGAALNFVAFFGFLQLNKEAKAKGVLIMTMVTAVAILIHKLLF
jgi:RsiW-degrading membrane proteinase PrsW (M82 family)